MALNKFMHPRNIYRKRKANFQHLAIKYPDFSKHVYPDVSGKLFLDFKNPEALRQLSITLMKDDFGLDVELPPDRLVPTIPLRLNYVLWIEDILKSLNVEQDVKGIDIGTGGSCVYPLLSTRMYRWKFLATEVDDLNFTYAVRNIQRNNMTEYIHVQKVKESAILLDVTKDSQDTYHFCMCNPPFFSDHLEAQGITNSRSDDRPEPHSVNTASSTESVAFGGEVEFVKKMILESIELKDKVKVYTSMVGKKSSLSPLKEELRKHKITNFSTTEFCQGKTMRWGIGWSFDESVKFPKSEFQEKKKEKRAPLSYLIPEDVPNLMYTIEGVAYQIRESFKELQIKYQESIANDKKISLCITAYQNTWSNQRRKRRQLKHKQPDTSVNTEQVKQPDTSVNTEQVTSVTYGKQDTNSGKRKFSSDLNNPDEKDNIETSIGCSRISEDQKNGNETSVGTEQTADVSNGNKESFSRKRKHSGDPDQRSDQTGTPIKCGRISTENRAKKTINNEDEKSVNNQSCNQSFVTNTDKLSISKHETEEIIKGGKDGSNSEANEGNTVCLCKCNVIIRQVEDEQILLEMSWIDGTVRESMNQVLQYLKNKLKCND